MVLSTEHCIGLKCLLQMLQGNEAPGVVNVLLMALVAHNCLYPEAALSREGCCYQGTWLQRQRGVFTLHGWRHATACPLPAFGSMHTWPW